jgi:hypothetical protein
MKLKYIAFAILLTTQANSFELTGEQKVQGQLWKVSAPSALSLRLSPELEMEESCSRLESLVELYRSNSRGLSERTVARYDAHRALPFVYGSITRADRYGSFTVDHEIVLEARSYIYKALNPGHSERFHLPYYNSERSALRLRFSELFGENLAFRPSENSLSAFALENGLKLKRPKVEANEMSSTLKITFPTQDVACDFYRGRIVLEGVVFGTASPEYDHYLKLDDFYEQLEGLSQESFNSALTLRGKAISFGRKTGAKLEEEFHQASEQQIEGMLINLVEVLFDEKLESKFKRMGREFHIPAGQQIKVDLSLSVLEKGAHQ